MVGGGSWLGVGKEGTYVEEKGQTGGGSGSGWQRGLVEGQEHWLGGCRGCWTLVVGGLGKWVDGGAVGVAGRRGEGEEMVLGWRSGGFCSVLVSGSHPLSNIWTTSQAYSAHFAASHTPRWRCAGMTGG